MIFNNSINVLTTEEIIRQYIDEFSTSQEREDMITGDRYYRVKNDILNRRIVRYEDDVAVTDHSKPNNKLAHGFMHILVDDKVNYLLTKPFTLQCHSENAGHAEKITEVLGKRFQKQLNKLGVEASNKGIGWLHVYLDDTGNLKTMVMKAEDVIPLWADNDKEELEAVIRYYEQDYYEGKTNKPRVKIEYWLPDGVEYYVQEGNRIILDSEMYLDYENLESNRLGHFMSGTEQSSWDKVPFIPFKNNDMEIPDLNFVKTLIDNYDLTRSDVANLLEEIKNIIIVLRGYGGESLSEFMRDLSYYKAVQVDEDGGVDSITNNIDIAAAKEHCERLFKDINVFGQGVDKDVKTIGNSPSGIALKFLYAGLDLKCNSLEEWFKFGFSELMYFVNMYLNITGQGVCEDVEILFNRDIAINESSAIEDCVKSVGIISDETIIENHPWTKSLQEEFGKMKKDNNLSNPYKVGGNGEE